MFIAKEREDLILLKTKSIDNMILLIKINIKTIQYEKSIFTEENQHLF
jgi:hypothetical protein